MIRKLFLLTAVTVLALGASAPVTKADDQVCLPHVIPGTRPVCIDVPPPEIVPPPDELRARGPTGCHAIDLWAEVDGSPVATVNESRSESETNLLFGFDAAFDEQPQTAHAEAHQEELDLAAPFDAHVGVVESRCDSLLQVQIDRLTGLLQVYMASSGEADVSKFSIDLNGIGVPLTVDGDVLLEHGATDSTGAGGNTADIATVHVCAQPPLGVGCTHSLNFADPNTYLYLPFGLGFIGLNEQWTTFVFDQSCYFAGSFVRRVDEGDALRLVIFKPGGGILTEVIVSWVSTTACVTLQEPIPE